MAKRQHAMTAGERDRRIYLKPVTQGVEESGFPTETDGTAIGLYARKEDISGRERFAADQLSSPYTTRWEVPYRPDIDPDLVNVPNLVLTPHIAGLTAESNVRVSTMIAERVLAALEGAPP